MEFSQRSRRSWSRSAESLVDARPVAFSARGGSNSSRLSRSAVVHATEYSRDTSLLSDDALDPRNTRLLIRFLHFRPDLSHAYATFRRYGKIRSCFLCAKQSKSSIIIDFESKESALALKSTLTTYITPDGVETRVKVFWGKRHLQKLPWEWKTPTLAEMVSRAREVHVKQLEVLSRVELQGDGDDAAMVEPHLMDESVTLPPDGAWMALLGYRQPDNRSAQGVGRYPLRLTDPWFEGSELQKNPQLSLGSLLDRSSGSWSSPSPLALSGSPSSSSSSSNDGVPYSSFHSRTSSPASSLSSARSSAASSLLSSSSSISSSPRSYASSFGYWSPGEMSNPTSDVDADFYWASPSSPHLSI